MIILDNSRDRLQQQNEQFDKLIVVFERLPAVSIADFSKDAKYGYDQDYPINVFYLNAKDETSNAERFLNALAGPKGEDITFKRSESCCPFPTTKSEMGAGFLDRYEITWTGQSKPIILYINIYERGALLVPVGFTLKK